LHAARHFHHQGDFNAKKQVYKSSKGFRVILNSIDEKKMSYIKQLQSPSNMGSSLFTSGQKKKEELELPLERNPS
jgi:hypothetical protein